MAFPTLFAQLSPEEKSLADYINNIFGFRPKNIALYKLAFTHKSRSEENVGNYHLSNERLEYLGDAVLSLSVADFLFRKYPTQSEGFLTKMRSRIVSRASLNQLSQKLGFDEYIRYVHDNGKGTSFRYLGGNTFEALMGSIYLDRGYDFTRRIIIDRIINVHIDLEQLMETETNFKSKILEWTQKQRKNLEFRLLEEIKKENRNIYHVQVFIDGKGYAEAIDYSVKGAEQLASEKTLQMLNN